MIIEIGTEILPNDPKWAWDPKRPLTGTTKFYVRVAEELVKRRHAVRVLYGAPSVVHNGVTYLNREGHGSIPNAVDLVIDCNLQRSPSKFNLLSGLDQTPRYQKHFQWTSFFGRTDTCVGEGYDRLFLVSDYVHSTLQHAVKCPVTVLELGCEMETVKEPNLRSRPKLCCYTSSPDRGGTFLQSIWPDVERETGYQLEMSPYGSDFSDSDLRALLDRSRFWLYPAIGTDSIISTLEAQARGCVPFYVPHMGLPETCRYGALTDLHRFRDNLIRTLRDADERRLGQWEQWRAGALNARPIPNWSDVVERILECL